MTPDFFVLSGGRDFIVSVLLSTPVERFSVSRMQDFFYSLPNMTKVPNKDMLCVDAFMQRILTMIAPFSFIFLLLWNSSGKTKF